jgi:hypothetical protein
LKPAPEDPCLKVNILSGMSDEIYVFLQSGRRLLYADPQFAFVTITLPDTLRGSNIGRRSVLLRGMATDTKTMKRGVTKLFGQRQMHMISALSQKSLSQDRC